MLRSRQLVLVVVGATLAGSASACSPPDPAPTDFLSSEFAGGAWATLVDAESISVEQGRFTTPHFETSQSEVLVTNVLEGMTAEAVGLQEGKSFRAAPGHEFVIAALQGVIGGVGGGAAPEEGVTATIDIVAGDSRLELTRRPGPYSERLVLAASVPVGDPVSLKVEDAGRVITWDLRTASYADDAMSQITAIYGRDRGQANIGGFLTTTGPVVAPPLYEGLFPALSGELVVTLDANQASFQVSPYVTGLSWAPKETVWAELIGFRVNYESELIYVFPGLGAVAEPSGAFSMTAPDGRVYPLASGNAALGTVQELLETQYAVFGVPTGFTAGTFSFAPQAPITGTGRFSPETVTWTQLPPPITVSVDVAR
ncbi:MAG: hypothetical protein ACR2I7_04575 [Geodermatophilaceae bacterium]